VYRDDPLDDEAELRALAGDAAVDELLEGEPGQERVPLEVALDVMRVLQGWVDDDEAGRWFVAPQRRLEDRTPIAALVAGDYEEVEDAARAWAAAHG
jgi:hypothetical protein